MIWYIQLEKLVISTPGNCRLSLHCKREFAVVVVVFLSTSVYSLFHLVVMIR